jgi:regulator of RNase E activity RraA
MYGDGNVHTGDIIVADNDSVAVIPNEQASESLAIRRRASV